MLVYKILRFLLAPLVFIFFRLKINGKENLPKEGGYIICSNHRSNFDPFFVGLAVRGEVTFIAKESLFKAPVIGAVVKAVQAIPVARDGKDISALKSAIKALKDGKILGIFPEGTRREVIDPQNTKSGIALIAARAGCPVVPACITGKTHLFGGVRVKIGQPIDVESTYAELLKEKNYNATSIEIMKKVKELENGD